MSKLAKKKKTQAGYRSYITKKINETHTILEKFEKLMVNEEDKEILVSNVEGLKDKLEDIKQFNDRMMDLMCDFRRNARPGKRN